MNLGLSEFEIQPVKFVVHYIFWFGTTVVLTGHRGIDQNIFLQKNLVNACVGARGPDWGFPEPK